MFFYATFLKICFTEAPPQFLPETKRFARVNDSSRFSAICDLSETIKNIFEKFYPEVSVFYGFSLRKMVMRFMFQKMKSTLVRNIRLSNDMSAKSADVLAVYSCV